MALSEFEIKLIEKAVGKFMEKRRSPAHIRDQLDFGYRIKGQSLELFEIRPMWNNPKKKMEGAFAKATYVKTKKVWKVFWMRADLKWHSYPPKPTVKHIEEFLDEVENDPHACFFG